MEPTREQQIAQINLHLGLPPEGEFSDAAIARLRSPQFLNLWGKRVPVADDAETGVSDALEIARRVNNLPSFSETWKKSPNYSGPSNFTARGAIFHFTGYSLESALHWLTDPASRASYHVIIAPDGSRTRLVDDTCRAWHAGGVSGSSKIHGLNPNGVCLGIAFTGDLYTGDHREGLTVLTNEEVASAMEFLALRWEKMQLSLDWVSDHRTVDPKRRNDIPPECLELLKNRIRELFVR